MRSALESAQVAQRTCLEKSAEFHNSTGAETEDAKGKSVLNEFGTIFALRVLADLRNGKEVCKTAISVAGMGAINCGGAWPWRWAGCWAVLGPCWGSEATVCKWSQTWSWAVCKSERPAQPGPAGRCSLLKNAQDPARPGSTPWPSPRAHSSDVAARSKLVRELEITKNVRTGYCYEGYQAKSLTDQPTFQLKSR